MKLSQLFKTLSLTTVLTISSSAISLVQQNKSIAAPVAPLSEPCHRVYTAFIPPNGSLQPGECVISINTFSDSIGIKTSAVGYFLILQNDGNLVLYSFPDQQPVWASGTNGRTVTNCIMQSDGNLVIYGPSRALWASNTNGHPNSVLDVQDDGNMVIYQSSTPQSTGNVVNGTTSQLSLQSGENVVTYSGGAIWATNTVRLVVNEWH